MVQRPYDEPLIKPSPLPGFSHRSVVYIPVDPQGRILKTNLSQAIIKEKRLMTGRVFNLEDKTILYHCVGAPQAVISLETLISSGAEEILVLGFCGSLQQDLKIGEAVLVKKALSEEGTSSHYFRRRKFFRPSPELNRNLEIRLRELSLPFRTVSSVSTDAPFRETRDWLAEKRTNNIDVVDMEVSAVFALSKFHGLRAAALLLVSDELDASAWNPGFGSDTLNASVSTYFPPFLD